MKIAKDAVVEMEYTLTNNDGEVLDTSEGGEPLAYLHGYKNIVSGLESELEGKGTGDTLKVTVDPANGYGKRNDSLIMEVPREELKHLPDLEVGMQIQSQGPEGMQVLTIAEVDDANVKLDANHPLAGITLNFAVEIKKVRAASPEEINHGHAHGAGGHHH